jgi:ribulose-5-phosphate 4-epimerase/fuculose-1-phosphate aldolase
MATDPVADIATARRALAERGCDTGIGGHVCVRQPERREFWINTFNRFPAETAHRHSR